VAEMELTEKEAHCVARLIQGGVIGKRAVDGCWFCKYRDECRRENFLNPSEYQKLAMKITAETGVDIVQDNGYPTLPPSLLPYRKFLKSSHSGIKEYFKNYFSDC